MTHTLVASATREHIIGFDRPFTVIGERINPTGRKKLAAELGYRGALDGSAEMNLWLRNAVLDKVAERDVDSLRD